MIKKGIKKKSGDKLLQQALEEEHRIRQAFKDKNWAEIKSSDSWVIFKVMSEFVEGFEKMAKIGPCVTIFGSARVKPNNPYYKMAEDIAVRLVQQGYGVITGGGPGIMEAGNKGANKAGGKSVGLNIYLPHEQKGNIYIPGRILYRQGQRRLLPNRHQILFSQPYQERPRAPVHSRPMRPWKYSEELFLT